MDERPPVRAALHEFPMLLEEREMEILFLIVTLAGFAFFAAVMVWADVYSDKSHVIM